METSIIEGNQWTKKSYLISGDWEIRSENGSLWLIFGDNFRTQAGPDLKLYLSKVVLQLINNRDPIDQKGLFIGELISHQGRQKYPLPKDIILSNYQSVVIHCKAYSVVWGGFPIQ